MKKHQGKILAVDDNEGIRSALKILISMYFTEVKLIASPVELMARIGDFHPDVVLLDMNYYTDINTGNEGLYWLTEIKAVYPSVEVVLFTAYADIALAVEGMKRGAFDFIVKPWDNEKLIEVLKKAVSGNHKSSGNDSGATGQPSNSGEEIVWGESDAILEIRKTIGKIAPTDATVLITGENGTGKDVLAKEIHRLSSRSGKPMVCVDLGAVTETLFESELFGHRKGSFTGAHQDHIGKFEQADGGTLFLDEIGNIPLHLQGKLLRVLQNREVCRVGDVRTIPIDIRLICATNMDIAQMVREGKFREDLYYRINTVQLHLPPLRERLDEIRPLVELYMKIYSEKYRRNVSVVSPDTVNALKLNYWSGNVRELRNCIEKAVILSDGNELVIADIRPAKPSSGMSADKSSPAPEDAGFPDETLEMAEERIIRKNMDRYAGNLTLVAKALNISRLDLV